MIKIILFEIFFKIFFFFLSFKLKLDLFIFGKNIFFLLNFIIDIKISFNHFEEGELIKFIVKIINSLCFFHKFIFFY
jgi:hypothetical protein